MAQKILIVDDVESSRAILREMFKDDYSVLEASNGNDAMTYAVEMGEQIKVILLDLIMDGMDGYEVMHALSKDNLIDKIPVIVVTAEDTDISEARVLELGAYDVITKPLCTEVVKHRVKNVIELKENQNRLERLTDELSHKLDIANKEVTDTLMFVTEHRNLERGDYAQRIEKLTKILLEEVVKTDDENVIDVEDIDIIANAASLHDIGKICIPDSILNKQGTLSESEFEKVKTHSIEGSKMVERLANIYRKKFLDYAFDICRYHHERIDGSGYPYGLEGDEIPIYAQIVGVTDAYEALTSEKPYKPAYSHEKAIQMILKGECGQFSELMKKSLENAADKFCGVTDNEKHEEPNADTVLSLGSLSSDDYSDSYKFDRYRNNALMRYIDALVIEIDLNFDEYTILYPRNALFDDEIPERGPLHFFEDAIVSKIIDADDARHARVRFYQLAQEATDGKRVYSSAIYRLAEGFSTNHKWAEITLMRIDTHTQRFNKLLVVVKVVDEDEVIRKTEKCSLNKPSSDNVWEKRNTYTEAVWFV